MTAEIRESLSKEEAAKIRLESQYAKYLKASASKSDIADLLRAGRISVEQAGEAEQTSADNNPPEIIKGLTPLATWIQSVFKIPCSKQSIKNWQKEAPPFPSAFSADYRFRWSEVASWVQRYRAKPLAGSGNAEIFAQLEPARAKEELAKFAHNEMMREVDAGKYLKKSDVNRWAAGVGKILNAGLDNRLELRLRVVALERFNRSPASPPLTAEQLAFVVDTFCDLGREANVVVKESLRTSLHARP